LGYNASPDKSCAQIDLYHSLPRFSEVEELVNLVNLIDLLLLRVDENDRRGFAQLLHEVPRALRLAGAGPARNDHGLLY
jgi:hypothetical protein